MAGEQVVVLEIPDSTTSACDVDPKFRMKRFLAIPFSMPGEVMLRVLLDITEVLLGFVAAVVALVTILTILWPVRAGI
jgi:hypothetical protein